MTVKSIYIHVYTYTYIYTYNNVIRVSSDMELSPILTRTACPSDTTIPLKNGMNIQLYIMYEECYVCMYVCMYVPSIRNAVSMNGYILFIRLVYPSDKDFFRMGVLLRTAAHICLTLADHLFHVHW